MSKKVLIIGDGGREHALAWKLASERHKIFAIPGNPGIAELGEVFPNVDLNDLDSVAEFAREHQVDLTVVGPEEPLMRGIVDLFQIQMLPIFGPTSAAAEIETSKSWCSRLLRAHKIPTPFGISYDNQAQMLSGLSFWIRKNQPFVIKYNGLAAGKGVEIILTQDDLPEALARLSLLPDGPFFVQEYVVGPEMSFFVLTDGYDPVFFGSGADYKQIRPNGPNTGGTGGYSPHERLTSELHETIMSTIVRPTITAMREDRRLYRGILYFQLMLTEKGPIVIEINCRFGDPEAQLLMPRMACDLFPYLYATTQRGELAKLPPPKLVGTSVGMYLMAHGYPGTPQKGDPITIGEGIENYAHLFHGATRLNNGVLETNGGRVVIPVGIGKDNYTSARNATLMAKQMISFDGMVSRADIAGHLR